MEKHHLAEPCLTPMRSGSAPCHNSPDLGLCVGLDLGSFIGFESKMKLWDVLAMCFLLLSAVSTSPLLQSLRSEMRLRSLAPGLSARPPQLDDDESEPPSEPGPKSPPESIPSLQEPPPDNQCKLHNC
ncbi:glial cell line-derived neurotrophic factor-like isoform X1 [Arapaima gigas]